MTEAVKHYVIRCTTEMGRTRFNVYGYNRPNDPKESPQFVAELAQKESNSYIAARSLRIWTHGVCFLDEPICLGPSKPREVNPELDLNSRSPRCRPYFNNGGDLCIRREPDAVTSRHALNHLQKASGIAGRKKLLRIGATPVGSAELGRPSQRQVEDAIGGNRPGVAACRCLYLGAVKNLFQHHLAGSAGLDLLRRTA
jgi:hypothetical protein